MHSTNISSYGDIACLDPVARVQSQQHTVELLNQKQIMVIELPAGGTFYQRPPEWAQQWFTQMKLFPDEQPPAHPDSE